MNNEMSDEFFENLAKANKPQRIKEIEQVKQLGESIGYGNLMDIASTLWAIRLEKEYGITSGAFIATIPSFMLKKEREKAVAERKAKMESFKKNYL